MAESTNKTGQIIGGIAFILGGIYLFVSLIRGTLNPVKWFSTSSPTADGTPCKLADGTDGEYKNETCVVIGILPDDNAGLRTIIVDRPVPSESAEKLGTTAPPTIFLTPSANCPQYTTANPYHYQGCSYVFGGYAVSQGRKVCLLKKVSCP